jgi:histidyl-tRNA synthetase
VSVERMADLLAIVDKLERTGPDEISQKLGDLGLQLEDVRAFIAQPGSQASNLHRVRDDLRARGLERYVEFDLTIVRGLAYYTGLVFEVFDRGKKERALAGGGRYDQLISLMSDGKVSLPALGFGMGDVVLGNFIDDHVGASGLRDQWIAAHKAVDTFVIIAKEERRPEALALIQKLRDAGRRVEFELTPSKVGKQFQAAEQLDAREALLVGDEWPQVKIKILATREERLVSSSDLSNLLGE